MAPSTATSAPPRSPEERSLEGIRRDQEGSGGLRRAPKGSEWAPKGAEWAPKGLTCTAEHFERRVAVEQRREELFEGRVRLQVELHARLVQRVDERDQPAGLVALPEREHRQRVSRGVRGTRRGTRVRVRVTG